jgi:hypothetical protein
MGKVQFVVAQAMPPKKCSDIKNNEQNRWCSDYVASCYEQAKTKKDGDIFVLESTEGPIPGKHGVWESYNLKQCKEQAAAAASLWGAPLKKGAASSAVASGGAAGASGVDDAQFSKGVELSKIKEVLSVRCEPQTSRCLIKARDEEGVVGNYGVQSPEITKLYKEFARNRVKVKDKAKIAKVEDKFFAEVKKALSKQIKRNF